MSWKKVIAILSFAIFAFGVDAHVHKRKFVKQIFDNILSSATYDPRIIPLGVNSTIVASKPVEVGVNLHVTTIHRIDDEKMLYSMDIIFRQYWVDDRLKYNKTNGVVYITLDDDQDIWTPDLFFNDYKGYFHDITKPNLQVRIYPNGTIKFSKRNV